MSHGNCIADIYKSVIADVISNMKEAFLDENIDVDVLSQLKKEWEDKVNSSGCVDLDSNAGPPAPRQISQPSNIRPNPMPPQRMNVGQQPPQNRHTLASLQAAQMGEAPIRVSYTQQGQQPQQVQQVRVFNPQQFHGQVPGFQPQLVIMQNAQGIPMSIMQNQLQQHRVFPNGPVGQQSQQGQSSNQLSHMNQLDGNGALSDSDGEGLSAPVLKKREKKLKKIHGSGATKNEALKVLGSLLKEIQLDGGGGGMSDSSSEDDQEEEDDHDPLRTIADRLTEGAEDGDQLAEEDPLNSEDDQSDDEDLTMLFDADNVVMCQFEKVNRARTKWKFQLKDGIMHIDKKDYCFQKCSGEAEW